MSFNSDPAADTVTVTVPRALVEACREARAAHERDIPLSCDSSRPCPLCRARAAAQHSLAGIVGVSASLALTQGRAAASATLATIDDVDRVLREGTAHLRTPESLPGTGVAPGGFILTQANYPSGGSDMFSVYRRDSGDVCASATFDFWRDKSILLRSMFHLAIVIEKGGRPAMEVDVYESFSDYDSVKQQVVNGDGLHSDIAPIAAELKRHLLALGPIQVENWPGL
jgi:hypothetical protein